MRVVEGERRVFHNSEHCCKPGPTRRQVLGPFVSVAACLLQYLFSLVEARISKNYGTVLLCNKLRFT
jgi:hypothetical protein